MNPESAQPEVDVRVAAVAERQYGVITRAQLRRLGVGDTGIRERLRTKRLHRLHRGVYAVGHRSLRIQAHYLAAVLACGDGAVLSHLDAAAHLGIRQRSSGPIHVTVPRRSGRRPRKGIRIHRSGRLGPGDTTIHDGIPTTTIARTLLDLADALSAQQLKRTIDEADYLRRLDMSALIAAVRTNLGRSGAKLMGAAQGPTELTRSALEDRFMELVERSGLPRPRVAAQIDGFEVDFHWPEAELVVEIDGFAPHGTRSRFEADRRRDRALARQGLRTIRLTASALRYEEEAIADELRALLSRSRASSNPSRRPSSSSASAR